MIHAILSADVKSFVDLGIHEPELWGIVAKGLARDREQRWQSSDDLDEALSTWLINREITHDVTGASLYATRDRCRARHMRQSQTERPPNPSGPRFRSSLPATIDAATSASRKELRLRIPRSVRYLFVIAMLAVIGVALRYTVKRAVRKEQPPSQPAVAMAAPKLEQPIAELKTIAPAPSLVPQQAVSESTPIQPAASPIAQPRGPSPSARISKSKPKSARAKSDPFKNPFD